MVKLSGLLKHVTRAMALLACVAGAALAQSGTKEVAGTYNMAVASPDGAVKVVIAVKKENGALTGTLSAEGFPTLPLTGVTPTATGVNMTADGVTIALTFGTEKVTGTLNYQGMDLPIEGTFTPAAAGATSHAGAVRTLRVVGAGA